MSSPSNRRFAQKVRKTSPWLVARKLSQALFLLGVLALLVQAPRMGDFAFWNGLILRIDPLAGLAAWLSGGVDGQGTQNLLNGIPVWVWAGAGLALSVVLGRAWCGWLCPLGTVLDWFGPKPVGKKRRAARKIPESWRKIKYLFVALILGSALLGLGGAGPFRGFLLWLALDPLSIFVRAFSSIWLAANSFVTWLEMELYPVELLQPAVSWLDGVLRPNIFPIDAVQAKNAIWAVLLLAGVVGLNWITSRFWCRYLCPLGGLLGLLSRFALLRRKVQLEDCTGCRLCSWACPTGTIDDQRGYISDPAECTMCLECLPACPRGDTSFRWVNPLKEQNGLWPAYDPTRRQALAAMSSGLAAAALVVAVRKVRAPGADVLRPPGASEEELLSRCVRCGVCVRTCPTGALQPAIFESGLEGLWTPMLVPRLGYCDYSCRLCGLACPEGAIPSLSLEVKRQQVIGLAEIDQDRCLPWSNQSPCIVCEEMCPLPEKAVWLEEQEIIQDGVPNTYQRPHVDTERCIGCGICEFKCPVEGEAAIRINVVN